MSREESPEDVLTLNARIAWLEQRVAIGEARAIENQRLREEVVELRLMAARLENELAERRSTGSDAKRSSKSPSRSGRPADRGGVGSTPAPRGQGTSGYGSFDGPPSRAAVDVVEQRRILIDSRGSSTETMEMLVPHVEALVREADHVVVFSGSAHVAALVACGAAVEYLPDMESLSRSIGPEWAKEALDQRYRDAMEDHRITDVVVPTMRDGGFVWQPKVTLHREALSS